MTTEIEKIKKFCGELRNNRVKNSKKIFETFELKSQQLFLKHAWSILSNQSSHTSYQIVMAYFVFKLFRSKDFKTKKIFSKYLGYKSYEKKYKKADEKYKENTSITKPPTKRIRKVYDKKYQKYDTPNELDSLRMFYESDYKETPTSGMSIKWLTEHGVFEGDERLILEKKYEKVMENKKNLRKEWMICHDLDDFIYFQNK